MTLHIPNGIRRFGAWMMCVLLIAAQLALPVAALATAADIAGMPTLTLNYWLSEEIQQSTTVTPSLSGDQAVYWAILPEAAFQRPITMDIVPAPGSPYTYTPANGSPISAVDAADFGSATQHITVYKDGFEIGGFELYVSSREMPVSVSPVNVPVTYMDEQKQVLYTEQVTCYYDTDNVIQADPGKVGEGYTIVGEDGYFITVDASGKASPSSVTFTVRAPKVEVQNGYVTIYYTDIGGNELVSPQVKELAPGTYNITPDFVPDGYVLSPECPSSFSVTVDEAGNVSRSEITFEFKESGTAEKETDPPVVTETDPPEETETDPPEGTDDLTLSEIGLYGLTNSVVNFRTGPGKSYSKVASDVKSGTYVWVIGSVSVNNETWYKMNYGGAECYAMSKYITLLSQEDSDAYNHGQTTPIPGTETQAPSDVQVLVSYVDADNPASVLYDERVSCAVGTDTEIVASTGKVPGYALVGDDRVTVSVSADGKASPSTVVFNVQKVAAKGTFTVRYVDTAGSDIATPQEVELAQGTHNITPDSSRVPQGYVLSDGSPTSQQLTIDGQGNASPSTITFTYYKPAMTAEITVEYKDTLGASIATAQKRTLTEGDNTVTADASVIPQGYAITAGSASSVNVTLDANGKATPGAVTFTYEKAAQKATVTIYYKDSIGEDIATPQTVELEKGVYPIEPNASLVPSGYTLTSSASVQVTVSESGGASPSAVTFTYQKPATSGKVTVSYVDTTGKAIAVQQEILLENGGPYPISPDESLIPADYALAEGSTTQVQVTVVNGVATPSSITFRYQKVETDMYMGYAVTITQTALRDNANTDDKSIIATLPNDTLLYLNGQITVGQTIWSGAQTVLGQTKIGIVQDSATKHITAAEAQVYIDAYNKANATPTPTPTPTPTKVPSQLSGYYITIGDDVPMRNVTSVYAEASTWLPIDKVVYVSGQLYNEGYTWHVSNYGQYSGYIREDQLRKMSDSEVQAYLASLATPTPTPVVTAKPYDPNANSSYGYVTASSVNFRLTPNGTKIKTLNKYALLLVYGTKEVNGVTWYNVNQGGTIGWVHGDYMHVMSLTELSSFLNSNQYYEGLANNSSSTTSSGSTSSGSTSSGTSSSSGTASAGTISSVEDWNVGSWQNTGVSTGLNASYAPFDPYATPVVSLSPDATGDVEPTATFVIGTMIPITYDDESKETQTESSPWGVIGAGVVLVGGAGGVYAYALNQNKKRKAAAARAAAAGRRTGQTGAVAGAAAGATTANKATGAQSPYARRAVAAPPVTGQGSTDQQKTGANGTQNPYTHPAGTAGMAGMTGATGSATNPLGTSGTTSSTSQGVFGAPMGTTGAQNPYARPAGQIPVKQDVGAAATTESGTSASTDRAEGLNPASALGGAAADRAEGIKPASALGGAAAGTATGATKSTNPYVQPISSGTSTSSEAGGTATDAAKPSARRSSRTQRYQSTEGNDGGDS